LNETVSGAYARTFAVAEQVAFLIAITALTLLLMRCNVPGAAPIRPLALPHVIAENGTPPPSAFDEEAVMSPSQLLDRWKPYIREAAQKFHLPPSWIRAVIARESGGRTMMAQGIPIASSVGAVGIMQLMPDTYDEMRAQYGLGSDPADPHDSVIAGAAYLKWLHRKYGFPNMFAAYNDGPSNFDKYLSGDHALPPETVAYLANLSNKLSENVSRTRGKRNIREARVSKSYDVQG
jgi:soluble lytic murein transglycosylase-like protein